METPTLTPSPNSVSPQAAGKRSKTIGYYAAFIALGLLTASLGPTLPGLAENTRTHLSAISFLFATRSFGYVLGSLRGGRLYDRLPGHSVLAVVLLTMAATAAMVPFTSRLWLLAAVMFALGAAEGMLDVGANTLLMWLHGAEVGPYMNGLHFCFGAGAFLSPILIAQVLLRTDGIAWAYWLLALLVLPAFFWLVRLPSPSEPATSLDEPSGQPNHLLAALVTLFLFLYVGAEVSLGGWVFSYATVKGLTGETVAAYLTSAFWGSFTVGRLLAIPLASRFRPSRILLLDLVGCLASMAVLVLWPDSLTMVWAGTLGVGFSMASIFPTTLSLAERRMRITGRVSGWFFMGAGIGAMSLPWLIGQLFESVGPHVLPWAVMIDLTIAVGVFVFLILHSNRIVPEVR